jgi:hypothetical protein
MALPADHNLTGVQHERVRRLLDERYRAAHDAMHLAYRTGTPFSFKGREFGVLDADRFQRLHDLAWRRYEALFHSVNQGLPTAQRYAEAGYNFADVTDNPDLRAWATSKGINVFNQGGRQYVRRSAVAQAWIAQRQGEGLELEV